MGHKVAVVGGGIIGLSTAYELALLGAEVTVLDMGSPASGASGAANGALTPYSDHDTHPAVIQVAERSIARYPTWLSGLRELTGLPIDHDVDGVLEIGTNEDELALLRTYHANVASDGRQIDLLDPDAVRELEPYTSSSCVGALHYKSESRIDLAQLLDAFISADRGLGVTFSYPTEVVAVIPRSETSAEVVTTFGRAAYDAVVLCYGINGCRVEGHSLPGITPIRGEIVEVWGAPGFLRRCVYRGDAFITPKRDGRLLVGTSYVPYEPGMNQDRDSITVGGALTMLGAAAEVVPAILDGQIRRTWKGWRPGSPDGMPYVGRLDGTSVVVGLGFGGLGFTLAAAIAPEIAELALHSTSGVDMSEFRHDRPVVTPGVTTTEVPCPPS